VQYKEDSDVEDEKFTQYEQNPKGREVAPSGGGALDKTVIRDKWVQMANGQFFQIQIPENEVKDRTQMTSAEPFDPSQTILGDLLPEQQHNYNHSYNHSYDNPYASFNLEDVQLTATNEEKMQSDNEFAQSVIPDSGIFDENQVIFKLEIPETCYQTDAIFASAIMKSTGLPLPLQCEWYNLPVDQQATGSNNLIQIPGATGACFQPSIEDVGTKICVHAIPMSEDNTIQRQYQGMPLFAEVGPLQLDHFL
jgi:hypothetical protein